MPAAEKKDEVVIELNPWDRFRIGAKTLKRLARLATEAQLVPQELGFEPDQYELFAEICNTSARYLMNEADRRQERNVLYTKIADRIASKFEGVK